MFWGALHPQPQRFLTSLSSASLMSKDGAENSCSLILLPGTEDLKRLFVSVHLQLLTNERCHAMIVLYTFGCVCSCADTSEQSTTYTCGICSAAPPCGCHRTSQHASCKLPGQCTTCVQGDKQRVFVIQRRRCGTRSVSCFTTKSSSTDHINQKWRYHSMRTVS